ncbi:hypothetical protein [Paenibacillus sp. BGI2013]|nr:hypothetical protein [Paenibacillus sp. BGI2013]
MAVEGLAARSLACTIFLVDIDLIRDFARCDLWTRPEPVVME